jgi:beta-lactamase class A
LSGVTALSIYSRTQSNLKQAKYDLLAKRILVDNPNQPIVNFSELSSKLNQYNYDNLQKIKSSIYFEYLPTGTSIGMDEDQQMIGASLIKLPLAINLYKLNEDKKINIDSKIKLKKEWLNNQYGELYKKGEGYEISYRELARLMLKDSDNTAVMAIFDLIDDKMPTNKLNDFIDIEYKINQNETLQMGARSYSSILKCLYFSCYLNKDNSQELLGYLSESEYDKRLLLYINDDINVAHKYGSYSNQVQSDCGIFYMTNKNYLLCVMVAGEDPEASRYIGDISQIVYEYMKQI